MDKKKMLHILPRILSIVFILFFSIFALDVFGQGYGFWETIVALFMHLIPSFILTAILVVAWKNEEVGGIIFLALSLIFTIFFNTYKNLVSFLMMSFPLIIIGILFLLNHTKKNPVNK